MSRARRRQRARFSGGAVRFRRDSAGLGWHLFWRDRQWYDLQGVLRLRGRTLDMADLQSWAERLEVAGLLDRALREAGLEI